MSEVISKERDEAFERWLDRDNPTGPYGSMESTVEGGYNASIDTSISDLCWSFSAGWVAGYLSRHEEE
jgi:hypothetical protein